MKLAHIVPAAALAIVLSCGEGTDAPTAPTAGETPVADDAPAEAAAPAAEAPPMGEAVGHFHPKGKPPSEHTLKVLEQARATLPFSDKRDFEEEKKGFIAAPESWKILGKDGNVVWDMERYKFLQKGRTSRASTPRCSASRR